MTAFFNYSRWGDPHGTLSGFSLFWRVSMSYNDLIVKFKQAQLVAREAYAAVSTAEHILRPDLESYLYAAKVRSDHGVKTELYGFCSGLAQGLVWDASRKLAPAGSKIDIARDDEMEEANLDIREALERGEIPALGGFWTHLERKFGGDAGRRVAYQQAAKAIIDGFYLRPVTEIRRVGGGVVINASVGSEASYVNRGLRRISTYSDQRVAALFLGLRAFARKAGFVQLAADCNNGGIVRDEYASREKLSLSGLEVTRFNDKWQFKFASQVGAALEIFISEFGADHLASRAN